MRTLTEIIDTIEQERAALLDRRAVLESELVQLGHQVAAYDQALEALRSIGDGFPASPPPDPQPAPAAVPEMAAPLTKKRERRRWPAELKQATADLARQVGAAEAAAEAAAHPTMVRRWMRQFPAGELVSPCAPPPAGETPAPQQGSSAQAEDHTSHDDPSWPFKCLCGSRFPEIGDWREHRKAIPPAKYKYHRLVEQPEARMVDTGLPRPPIPGRTNVPDVVIVQQHSPALATAR